MRKKKPHFAVPDEVRIVQKGQYAEIEYCDPTVAGVSLKVGPEVQNITDQDIVNRLNDVIRTQQKMAAQHEYVAVEIAQGHPQIRYSEKCDQWVPRGGVLNNGLVLLDVSPFWQLSIKGFVILLAVAIDKFNVKEK